MLLLVFVGGYCINDFRGLWGIGPISSWYAVPLTVFATVKHGKAINVSSIIRALIRNGWKNKEVLEFE